MKTAEEIEQLAKDFSLANRHIVDDDNWTDLLELGYAKGYEDGLKELPWQKITEECKPMADIFMLFELKETVVINRGFDSQYVIGKRITSGYKDRYDLNQYNYYLEDWEVQRFCIITELGE